MIVATLVCNAGASIFHSLDLERFRSQSGRRDSIIDLDGTRGSLGDGRLIAGAHGDIDIFEDLTRSDAQDSIVGFDEIVALPAAMLAAEMVDEREAGAELFGFDQEPSAVSFPFRGFHRAQPNRSYCHWRPFSSGGPVGTALFFIRGESECTREMALGQSNIFGAIEENSKEDFSGILQVKYWLSGACLLAEERQFLCSARDAGEIW